MSATFAGRVWIADDGTIAAVTRGRRRRAARLGACRSSTSAPPWCMPGLVDLHNHLAYNTLPLWTEPERNAVGASQLVDHGGDVRRLDHLAGVRPDHRLPRGAAGVRRDPGPGRRHDDDPGLAADEQAARRLAGAQRRGRDVRHRRPQPGLRVGPDPQGPGARPGEPDARRLGVHLPLLRGAARLSSPGSSPTRPPPGACSRTSLRCMPMPSTAAPWPPGPPGAIAWSPFSNLWLYGVTTDIPAARAAGVACASARTGGRPAPSTCSARPSRAHRRRPQRLGPHRPGHGRDDDSNPGDVLARSWGRQIGRLQPGAIADIVVIEAASRAAPSAVVGGDRAGGAARRGGGPLYGTPA